MAKREKFGKFVLLEEIDASRPRHRIPRGEAGPHRPREDRHRGSAWRRPCPRTRTRVKLLMDQVKFAAQLHSPNIVKVLGIGGKVGSPCWVSCEFIEGKSLKAVFDRTAAGPGSRSRWTTGLLIASKVCVGARGGPTRAGRVRGSDSSTAS